jgi:hypothetical protein
MRHTPALIAVILLGPFAGRAAAQGTARDVVERAIKARCPKGDLLKQRAEVFTMEGTVAGPDGAEMASTREIQVEWPTQYRMSYEIDTPDGKKRATLALSIDRAWQQPGGMPPTEMTLSQVDEFKSEVHGYWMGTLYPLRDKAVALTLLPNARVDDEPVGVVKASVRFRPDVYLSFGKKSGQLLKLSFRAREAGVEIRKEQLYADFKEFDGLVLPAKVTDLNNGKKAAEWTLKTMKFVEKLGPNPFEKDEKK